MASNALTDLWLAIGYVGFAVAIDKGIRPTRAECRSGPRPCPWIACRHHLANEESEAGTIHLLPIAFASNHNGGRTTILQEDSDIDLDSLFDHLEEHGSCALDFDQPHTLAEIGAKTCVTRERVRQHEVSAYRKIRAHSEGHILQQFLTGDSE